ncbi:helix-turn-helix domain-containing protein [Actinomadura barringtoniae]|uniref:Helix-turn-helix domain-containing protein n=1 Tax=Actinomadura barringtoniae TaxID=1427535 RepID=A0A939PGI5_9ACTN|nr:helix-turn-helix transcriptional regulator [Actinomadura barringtoniae]MBO2452235.1 helix-turn-helix domain-containing protein [Actinomadura barringtoniae]
MSASPRPSVRQRRLAAELRRLREDLDLTGDDVAARLEWSTAKVSRIENARTGARLADVRRMLDLYEVNGPHREELVELAKDAAEKRWWEDYPSIGSGYAQLIALEADASKALCWENLVIPGLLQTEAYARSVIRGWQVVDTLTPQEIERRIEVRMRRQQVVHRQTRPLELGVVLDEAVLKRRIGDPEVMIEQVEHLHRISTAPHIQIQIMPLNNPHRILGGSFTLLEFPPLYDTPFPDTVHTESLTLHYLENERETNMYRLAHDQMGQDSLSPDESRLLLEEIRDWWRRSS